MKLERSLIPTHVDEIPVLALKEELPVEGSDHDPNDPESQDDREWPPKPLE